MKRIVFVAVLLLGAFNVQAQSIGGSPFIAVQGKAKAEVVPDIFPLEITLKDTSLDTAVTQAQIEGVAQQVVALTKSMKMADRDVEISNLSVSPEYRWDDKADKQIFLGNTYARTIKLRFHALPDLQKAIDALPKTKQVQLDTGSFQSSRQDDIRRELLTQAVQDARKTAEIMAGAVGRRVGGVHNISNQGFNVRYVTSNEAGTLDSVVVSGSRMVAPAPPATLREGVIQLDQNVYIIYTLVD
jgi:uncharacterized protein YggE